MQAPIIRYRRPIIIISIIIVLLAMMLIPRIHVNPDLDAYVPDYLENQVNLKKLDSLFGGSEMIIVMLHDTNVVNQDALSRLQQLASALSELEGVDQCISPFDAMEISNENGFMVMTPLLEELPETPEGYEALKAQIQQNNMAKRFFSEDFSLASIIITKNSLSTDLIIEDIQEIIDKIPGHEEVLMGGLPFIRYSISGNIRDDIVLLVPLALVLMVFMLYFSFKEWRGVYLPFLIVVMSIILSFGVMALLGWQVSLITILMPIMLIAIANDYGIHLIARYQEILRSGKAYDMKEICLMIYKDLRKPIIITGLTTIGGVLGLLTHTMVPAAQLGILTAIGIGFALLLSIWFLPAVLSYSKIPTELKQLKHRHTFLDSWLQHFGNWTTVHPWRIVIISSVIGVFGTLGILLLKIDTNIEGYFLGKSDIRRSIDLINEKLGGTQFISIVFSGDVLQPELLQQIEAYEKEIAKDPSVGHISSPVTLLKELSKGFYFEGESGYFQLPASADEAYQFIEVFAMGGHEEAVEQFFDYDYENARMLISLKDGSNAAGKNLYNKLKAMTDNNPNLKFIAGSCLTKIELADLVVMGQVKSLVFAMIVIFILVSLVFRSPWGGIISSLPLSLAIMVLFGLMGILGISLDIATALLSSIMIGVGVDYTIHFLWRYKSERASGLSYTEAVKETLLTSGRGIIINALSVIIGFIALSLSNFAPLRFFSALIIISISICLISALVLVPAITVLTKPRFLDK